MTTENIPQSEPSFSDLLYNFRDKNKLSIPKLAAAIGYSESSVKTWLNGERIPPLPTRQKIQKAIDSFVPAGSPTGMSAPAEQPPSFAPPASAQVSASDSAANDDIPPPAPPAEIPQVVIPPHSSPIPQGPAPIILLDRQTHLCWQRPA